MATERLRWPDTARGGAMVLVVLAHTLQLMAAYGWELGWLDTANTFLTAIRMPLFFVISGMLAATVVRKPWSQVWARRLWLLVYVYVLWSAVRALWFTIVPWPLSDVPPWQAFVLLPVWPTTGLWFLFALVLYITLLRFARSTPTWAVLGLAGGLSVAAAYDVVPTGDNPIWRSIALYLFFFALGVRGAPAWKALAAHARAWWAVPAVILIPAAFALFRVVPSAGSGLARVILSTVCVVACVVIASSLARSVVLSSPLVAVGRRTLPVYVLHALLLATVVPWIPANAASAPFVAFSLTLGAVAACVGLSVPLSRVPGVFAPPRRWQPQARAVESTRDEILP
ncbi:acyltransferase family protein [Microbacterium proteolyticum]|uniref:acyltransferase family protein n=1 Tax=Microbacterium proteolyticum TaxID=1572644 RepID=UPI0024338CFA|nr:acyltransferase family protein [Microbacterium proteolyticum]